MGLLPADGDLLVERDPAVKNLGNSRVRKVELQESIKDAAIRARAKGSALEDWKGGWPITPRWSPSWHGPSSRQPGCIGS
jgi:hypothetical protein